MLRIKNFFPLIYSRKLHIGHRKKQTKNSCAFEQTSYIKKKLRPKLVGIKILRQHALN